MKTKSSKNKKAILVAFEKGYRSTLQGDIVSPKGNVLKPIVAIVGGAPYYHFHVRVDKNIISVPYHRYVAYQKFGDIMFECDEIRHLDGNSTNNTFDNIEMGTHQDNMLDIPKEKRVAIAKHASSCCGGYNDDERVKEIKAFYTETKSYKKTMENFGISSKGTLHFILNNR